MPAGTERSVTRRIESLKAGDADAAQGLWRRYFAALVRLARPRLQGATRAVADEEDAALSALMDQPFEARGEPREIARPPQAAVDAGGPPRRRPSVVSRAVRALAR
jgi:hypothetical protein